MILPLRQRHRLMVCALGVCLPTAFALGIAARRPVPVVTVIEPGLASRPDDFGDIVSTTADIWPGQRIITHLRRDAAGDVAVELMCGELTKPDVLVYWAAGDGASIESLPGTARFLGSLAMRSPLRIPSDARGEIGRFVLYSLANHEVVAASKPFTVQRN